LSTEFTRDHAKAGQELLPGNGLETVGRESFARIKYLNVVDMDLDAETLLQQWLEESPSRGQKGVLLKRGALRVSLATETPGKALVFSTPHLDVQPSPSTFRLIVGASSTQVLVERGTLRATRRTDGSSTLLQEGTSLECGGKDLMAIRPICAPGGRLVADFDSHVEFDWIPSRQSTSASMLRSVAHPGLQGSGSLHLEYAVPASEMVWVTQMYPTPQDWSGYSGVSFWFKGVQSQAEIILELWENRDLQKRGSEPERFWYRFKDEFLGWKKFDARWAEFKRRPFPNTPDDGFTRKEMWGVCIIIPANGRERQGSCEFDQIELIAPASGAPEKPWTPLFDGKNLDAFVRQTSEVWRLDHGALVWDSQSRGREAMRTTKSFGDAEVRVRFDVVQDIDRLYFAIRQEADGRYMVSWAKEEARELRGRPHELLFVCRGEDVSATLDGKSVQIELSGRPREGHLQFSATSDGLRILSIEYR
ncbi:MAG TPA: carbohydrate binding domain-containing protein, partial [Planctomycetota bacterium]|nr:carbohydrate binding domain-containing protein [Planctomycetota bacterium]